MTPGLSCNTCTGTGSACPWLLRTPLDMDGWGESRADPAAATPAPANAPPGATPLRLAPPAAPLSAALLLLPLVRPDDEPVDGDVSAPTAPLAGDDEPPRAAAPPTIMLWRWSSAWPALSGTCGAISMGPEPATAPGDATDAAGADDDTGIHVSVDADSADGAAGGVLAALAL